MTEYKPTPPTPDDDTTEPAQRHSAVVAQLAAAERKLATLRNRSRKPRGERALTGAERQARYRQRQAERRGAQLRHQENITFQELLDVHTAGNERLARERGPRALEAPGSTVAPETQGPNRPRPRGLTYDDDPYDDPPPDNTRTFNQDMSVRRVATAAELNRGIEKPIRDPRMKADAPHLIEMARLMLSDIKLTRWGAAAIVAKDLKGSSLYAHTRRLDRKFKEAETQVPSPAWIFERIGPEGMSFFDLLFCVRWSRETPPPKN